MLKKYSTIIILSAIFISALLFRTIHLSVLPYSMHADEVVNTFVGRYILLHGVDPNGNAWPVLYFDKFGDYPPVLPMYLSGFATFLFGVNAFASRIPSAFFGSLLIFPVFFLTKRFFNEKIGLTAAAILAIFPWHIVLSRASSEGIIALTCFAFALLFFIKGFKENKYAIISTSVVLFCLTYLLYPSFRIITPLSVFPFIFLFKEKRQKIAVLCISLFCVGLTLLISSTVWGKGRFTQTSVFTNQDVIRGITIDNQIFSNDEGANNIFLARVFHNKITGYYSVLANNYLAYFSPGYLFSQEGRPDRYVVPQQGLLLLVFIVFFISLFLFDAKDIRKSPFHYLFYLLLISPIPAALTVDDSPNIHRSITMIIPLVIFIALGIHALINLFDKESIFEKRAIAGTIIVVICVQFVYFFHQYAVSQTSYKSILRNDGNKELVMYIEKHRNTYKKIIVPSAFSLSAYYVFYTNNFQERKFGKFITVDTIDNIEFRGIDCPSYSIAKKERTKNLLVVDNALCSIREGYSKLAAITRKDGTVAFTILTGR